MELERLFVRAVLYALIVVIVTAIGFAWIVVVTFERWDYFGLGLLTAFRPDYYGWGNQWVRQFFPPFIIGCLVVVIIHQYRMNRRK